ncbi:MAG: hypothetical protein HKN72_10195 [Gemmatimonadetes bacterium]|nr:hypothetical protein [Gemmatimonadota bacterium]
MSFRWGTLRGALLLVGWLLFLPPEAVTAQEAASVRVEENFRREPNGLILARVSPGAEVRVLDSRDGWSQVELSGWVWLPSLQVSDDPDLGLVVSASDGENLRAEPRGAVRARLVEGALLAELERQPSWARVSRIGWIWTASLQDASLEAAPSSPPPAASPPVGPRPPAARAPGDFVASAGGAILVAPDGDTLAVARPTSDVQVVRREGNWARVRLEGWMWMPGSATPTAEDAPVEETSALEPGDLASRPDEGAGRAVEWTLQFISLERAEEIRTDFFRGEPFLLTRFGGGDGPFVYVAVPLDRLDEVEGLVPLESISITGRIRTGASSLTGVPIVDLVSIRRAGGAP